MRPISAFRVVACLGFVVAAGSAAAEDMVATNIASVPYKAFTHAWDPARRALYLSDREGHRVQRLAPDGSVVATWTAADTQFPEALAFSPDRKRIAVALPERAHNLYWTEPQSGAVAVLDADTLVSVRMLPLALDPFDVALFDDGRIAVSGGSGGSDGFTSVQLFGPDGLDAIGDLGIRHRVYLVPSLDGTRLYATETDQFPSVRRLELNAVGTGALLSDSGREYDGGELPTYRPTPRPDGTVWISNGGDLVALSAARGSDLVRTGTLARGGVTPLVLGSTVWDTARPLLFGTTTLLKIEGTYYTDQRLQAYNLETLLPIGSWALDPGGSRRRWSGPDLPFKGLCPGPRPTRSSR